MNGPDGKPTKPDDDFEPLVPALEEWFEKEFAELPIELQERITHVRRCGDARSPVGWDHAQSAAQHGTATGLG